MWFQNGQRRNKPNRTEPLATQASRPGEPDTVYMYIVSCWRSLSGFLRNPSWFVSMFTLFSESWRGLNCSDAKPHPLNSGAFAVKLTFFGFLLSVQFYSWVSILISIQYLLECYNLVRYTNFWNMTSMRWKQAPETRLNTKNRKKSDEILNWRRTFKNNCEEFCVPRLVGLDPRLVSLDLRPKGKLLGLLGE